MIIYIEKQVKEYSQTKKILKMFPNADIVWINHYKNIFDKQLWWKVEKSFILAKLTWSSVLKAPDGYGHNNLTSYFFKTSIGCVFDCSYCYLKWAFKNEISVYFLNYEDIKKDIVEKSKELIETYKEKNNDYELVLSQNLDYKDKIWFYSSDYSDILGMNAISGFMEEFVPFFENLENTMMEIRTKSSNIKDILNLGFVPKNTEFAFSLNPQELIDKYEKWTSSLENRIKSINILLDKWYKVWLRFLPLLPVKNYKEIYISFVDEILEKINIEKVSSTFVSWLLYTKEDYKVMLKKYPNLDVLYYLQQDDEIFVRESRKVRDFFYNLFKKVDRKCFICLDK